MTSPLEVTNPLTPSSSMPVKEYVPVKKIPRPMNCFMTYRLEKQQQIVNQCPGANHRDISKIIAKWWRELSDEEKDPYRIKAAEAKAKHLERYPEYKYRPTKKVTKTRPYKKRPENEFSARDFDNKHQLFSLYHNGKVPNPPSCQRLNDDSGFILDPKPQKNTTRVSRLTKKPILNNEQSSPSTSTYPGPDDSPLNLNLNSQFLSPYETGVPSANNVFYTGSLVLPHNAYPILPNPYSLAQMSVNYQPYFNNNRYIPHTESSHSLPYHFTSCDQFYKYDTSMPYANYSNHSSNQHSSVTASSSGFRQPVIHFM